MENVGREHFGGRNIDCAGPESTSGVESRVGSEQAVQVRGSQGQAGWALELLPGCFPG